MPNLTNGVYSNRPWIAPPEAAYPPQAYIGPFASNQEQNLSQALASLTMSSEALQQYVRPNIPQVELFPQKYGYSTKEYSLDDIVELNVPVSSRVDSPVQPDWVQSSSRNTLGYGV